MQKYSADPSVEYTEANYLARITLTPNDTFFASDQWNLDNTGQTGGTPDADIDAPEAWDNETGDPSVIIAVIDTAVDLDHPDLAGQIWINPGETPGDTIDNDGNGYPDDVNGWDFVNGDNDPDDDHDGLGDRLGDHWHGSHVSAIAAAIMNNSEGIAGVCPNCTIMPLKVCNAGGSCSWVDIAKAIR